MEPTTNPKYFDKGILNVIGNLLCDRIDDLQEKLEFKLRKRGKILIGNCPIHGGDNVTALTLYPDGYAMRGYWKCRTHHCETVFKPTVLGFLRGILSNKHLGWDINNRETNRIWKFERIVDWACKFLDLKLDEIQADAIEVKDSTFIKNVNTVIKKPKQAKTGLLRSSVRAGLQIPAEFFLKRGYPAEILDSFDIGVSKKDGTKVIVPVYDDNRLFMVGHLARSIFDKCDKCNCWHYSNDPFCPENPEDFPKWRNHGSLNSYLYNYWNAKNIIRETGTIILVEGPADVWRLEQFGIRNAVAIFGVDLTDEQQIIIECSGALRVVVLLDTDKAGEEGIEGIQSSLNLMCHVIVPKLSVKDPGELTQEIFDKELKGIIK